MKRRRTEDFDPRVGPVPEFTHTAWRAVQHFFKTVRAQQRDRGKEIAGIAKNADLTDSAKNRRLREIHIKAQAAISPAWEAMLAARDELRADVDAHVEQASNVDPFAPGKVKLDGLDPANRVIADLLVAQQAQSADVARLLAEGKVERMIDRAVDRDPDGVFPVGLYDQILESGDPLIIAAFESHGLERLRAEGSGILDAFESLVESAREARLPEEAKLMLDHRDAIEEAVGFSEAVHAEAQTVEFLQGDKTYSMALGTADQVLGPFFAGLEE